MPSPKWDQSRRLQASVKCDTCTSDADASLSSVMKENKIVFLRVREGERAMHVDVCSCCAFVLNR